MRTAPGQPTRVADSLTRTVRANGMTTIYSRTVFFDFRMGIFRPTHRSRLHLDYFSLGMRGGTPRLSLESAPYPVESPRFTLAPLDNASGNLVGGLDEQGLLDSVLVVTGNMGRSPKSTNAPGANTGRYEAFVSSPAGKSTRATSTGTVTTPLPTRKSSRSVPGTWSPHYYQLLEIDPAHTVPDRFGPASILTMAAVRAGPSREAILICRLDVEGSQPHLGDAPPPLHRRQVRIAIRTLLEIPCLLTDTNTPRDTARANPTRRSSAPCQLVQQQRFYHWESRL